MISAISSWATTISLVFGGCCANALTLEQLTLTFPGIGSLITFLQFVIISLHGIPNHITWTRYGPRFKPRRIPLLPYLGQVSLFYLISLLNNAAFAYNIPMPVHIIFRSGGLVVSMILGWLVSKKRYNLLQVVSVFLVTVGVALTTLSASQSPSSKDHSFRTPHEPSKYITGIGILSLALLLSGFLGILQDWTYSTYGRPTSTPTPSKKGKGKRSKVTPKPQSANASATWQESMFYLHFLGLPMFFPLLGNIREQFSTINYGSPRTLFKVPIPFLSSLLVSFFPSTGGTKSPIPPPYRLPSLDWLVPEFVKNNSFVYPTSSSSSSLHSNPTTDALTLSIPKPYLPLVLNTITQLFCVAGVNRLTTRVSNLTVTLVLVVRKAVSLVISLKGRAIVDAVLGAFGSVNYGPASDTLSAAGGVVRTLLGLDVQPTGSKQPPAVNEAMLWSGAALVLLGTISYSIATGRAKKSETKKGKTD